MSLDTLVFLGYSHMHACLILFLTRRGEFQDTVLTVKTGLCGFHVNAQDQTPQQPNWRLHIGPDMEMELDTASHSPKRARHSPDEGFT